MTGWRCVLVAGIGAALALTTLPSPAGAVANGATISQVYGGGGTVGASLTNDFVELHNSTSSAYSLSGMSLQYGSTGLTSGNWTVVTLSGSIPAHGYFLVQLGSSGADGGALPTPDLTATTNMATGSGRVALMDTTSAITNSFSCPTNTLSAFLVDEVSYGSSSICPGETFTGTLSNTTAALRRDGGCIDTNDNSADFTIAAPAPRNSASAAHLCNSPPLLSPVGDKSGAESAPVQFTINATDSDPDTLTYTASNLPPGAAFDTTSHTFSWTPGFDQAGTYSNVHFQVTDGTSTDSEDITITVANTDRPPVLDPIGPKTVAEGNRLQFTLSAADPDAGDVLGYSATGLPAGSTFDADSHVFSWTPDLAQAGTYPGLHFEVSDGATTDAEDVTISVSDTPTGGDDGPAKSATALTLNAKAKREKVKVNGSLLPAQSGGQVSLTLLRSKKRGAPMKPVRSAVATVDATGAFAAKVKRKEGGKCQVKAEWPGDDDSLPSSAAARLRC